MELTRERLIIAIVGVAAIAVAGIYFLLYAPLIRQLRVQYLESKSYEAKVENARRIIKSMKEKETGYAFLSEVDSSLAIDELTRNGKTKGIDFISITPKKIEEVEGSVYKTLDIDMEVESSYKDLGMYLGSLDELESSVVTVKSFNISPPTENPERLRTILVVNMYFRDKG